MIAAEQRELMEAEHVDTGPQQPSQAQQGGMPRDLPGTRIGARSGPQRSQQAPPAQRRSAPPRGGRRGNAMDALSIFGGMS